MDPVVFGSAGDHTVRAVVQDALGSLAEVSVSVLGYHSAGPLKYGSLLNLASSTQGVGDVYAVRAAADAAASANSEVDTTFTTALLGAYTLVLLKCGG